MAVITIAASFEFDSSGADALALSLASAWMTVLPLAAEPSTASVKPSGRACLAAEASVGGTPH